MRFIFSMANSSSSGKTEAQTITVYLRHIYSERDIVEVLIHESFHAVMNQIKKSTGKEDHYILKRIEPEWF